MKKKVIFDTDIGIDDAMALLVLHASPEVDLCAICTVFGNASVEQTTLNAQFLKQRFSLDAPVYAGAAEAIGPRLGEGYPDFVHGKNGLGDIPITAAKVSPEPESAAQAIVRLVNAHPHQLSLVAVGRMTNIAQALSLDPSIASKVKELVVMGGVFGVDNQRGNVSPVAEANISGDPTAADRVFTAGMPLTVVGLDVTHKVTMDWAYIEQIRDRSGDAGELIAQTSKFYFDFHQRETGTAICPIHDSSAVAYLLRPELFATRTAGLRVVTQGIALGQTIAGSVNAPYDSDAWRGLPEANYCTDVDAAGVRDFLLETLAGQG